jgi:hypothetical protein
MRRRCIPHGTFAGDTAGILACYVGSEWCRVSGVGPGCNRAFRFGCECSASATRPSSVSSSCNGSITRRHGHYRRMSTIYERRNNGHYRRTVPRTPCGQLRATVRNILRRDPLGAPVRTQLSLSRSRRPQTQTRTLRRAQRLRIVLRIVRIVRWRGSPLERFAERSPFVLCTSATSSRA